MLDARRHPLNGRDIEPEWGEARVEKPISRPRWEKISAKVLTDPRS